MSSDVVLPDQLEQARADCDLLRSELGRVIVGQEAVIEAMMAALFVGGHVLVESAPGLGKTLLVRTLADALDVTFRRGQEYPSYELVAATGRAWLSAAQPLTGNRPPLINA